MSKKNELLRKKLEEHKRKVREINEYTIRLEKRAQEYMDEYSGYVEKRSKAGNEGKKHAWDEFDMLAKDCLADAQSQRKSIDRLDGDVRNHKNEIEKIEMQLADMEDKQNTQQGLVSGDLEMMRLRERLLDKELEIERLRQQGARAENEEIKGLIDTIRNETGN